MNTITKFKINKMSPQFIVGNIERSVEFYTTVLGFGVDFLYEDFYAGISKDGYSIHLKEGQTSSDKRIENNEHLDLVFSVDDIEDLYQEISSRSVEIVQALREMPYGKEFYFSDPDGHVIAFSET